MSRAFTNTRGWIASIILLATLVATGAGLAAWKYSDLAASDAAAAAQPEPTESVMAAVATRREHRPTTTSIGTVLALRSITLRNELAGTVRQVRLEPGQIVEAGAVLVALDVSVEEAELEAQEAQAALAKTTLERLERLREHNATSQEEVDQARAAARRGPGADRAHPGGHRQEDHSRAVPRPRRHRRRASGPVPERRHRAHHAAGRGRRGARGLHRGAARRRGPRGGRQRGGLHRQATPTAARRASSRSTRASIRPRGTPWSAPASPDRSTPSPGASVRVLVPVGATDTARRRSR